MSTNPDFDWDEVIVTKRPKQKELECAFLSDPDLDLGSRPDEAPETVIIESTGLTECQQQSCGAAEAYQNVLAYDEMARCYGQKGVFTFVDTPAAVKFRISNEDNFPTGPSPLTNSANYNIVANYPMVDFPTVTPCVPCEAKFEGKQLDAVFLNASATSSVAFYPRAFENLGGRILQAGEHVNVKTMFGQMFWGKRNDGLLSDSPNPARHTLGRLRCLAFGATTPGGNVYNGTGSGGINAVMEQQIVTTNPNLSNATVDLTSDSLDWFASEGGFPLQRDYTTQLASGSNVECNFFRGDITGAYMCKLEWDIQMSQDGNSANWYMFMESEHVKSGKKVRHTYSGQALTLNGSLKISDPYEISFSSGTWNLNQPIDGVGNTTLYNDRGGMEATTRYWTTNANIKRTMWLIAYDGWENEDKVRKACWEMERSRPSWQPKDYCSRIQ